MTARATLFAQLAVLLTLAVLHIAGMNLFLYWEYRWLDFITHFLGGVWVGLFTYWPFTYRERPPHLLLFVCMGLILGSSWELFEIGIGALDVNADIADTLTDLVMGVLGSTLAGIAALRLRSS